MNIEVGRTAGRSLEITPVPVPQVAIVGRPNVGKSSLFNWLAGRRIAIVDPTPGVTRDRLTALIQVGGRYVEIVDTGGMGIEDKDQLTDEVERQIAHAVEAASVLLFVVDARSGLTPLDQLVAQRLRPVNKPVVLIANKCDETHLDYQANEFYRLGLGEVHCVSALQHRGKETILSLVEQHLPPSAAAESVPGDAVLKIAVVGRRNTGKSTFINALAQEERTIVSEVEGTTRDSVDVRSEKDGQVILAIDTAGVRHRGSVKSDIEFYSLARAERSIRRADVVLHFLDAPKTISTVDKQLAGYVLENYKPTIFVVNKWDLVKKQLATSEFGDYVRKVFPSLDFVPIAFLTAKDGKNVQLVLDLAKNLHKQASVHVPTGLLNRVIQKAYQAQPPSIVGHRQGKIYYAAQVAIQPPTIVVVTNGPHLFDNTYQRYLLKALRDELPYGDIPIKLYLRHKRRDDSGGPDTLTRPRPQQLRQSAGALWKI
ncbi:MAG: ribosome biogenesis GTPase Der [Gemmataceae bacterium]|nr:ribosome biogenesis GTPase Der [Gemmataceae bacterium]